MHGQWQHRHQAGAALEAERCNYDTTCSKGGNCERSEGEESRSSSTGRQVTPRAMQPATEVGVAQACFLSSSVCPLPSITTPYTLPMLKIVNKSIQAGIYTYIYIPHPEIWSCLVPFFNGNKEEQLTFRNVWHTLMCVFFKHFSSVESSSKLLKAMPSSRDFH